jgi:hypothetical protein
MPGDGEREWREGVNQVAIGESEGNKNSKAAEVEESLEPPDGYISN